MQRQSVTHHLPQADRSLADQLVYKQQPPWKDYAPCFLLPSMTFYGMEYPFGQLGSAVLAVSPPNLLP